jgi:hypothetical protein
MAVQFCVVCGRVSQRASWPRSGTVNGVAYVSCDFHSRAAILMSVLDTGGIPSTTQVYQSQHGKVRKTVPEANG